MYSSQCRRVTRYPVSKSLNVPRHTGINLEQAPWFFGAMTPRFLDLLFPCFLAFKFLRAQGPKLLRVAGSPCAIILHGTKAHTFPASLVSSPLRSTGILLIEVYRQSMRLVQHAPSIRLASGFRGDTPAMMAQATWSLRQLGSKVPG